VGAILVALATIAVLLAAPGLRRDAGAIAAAPDEARAARESDALALAQLEAAAVSALGDRLVARRLAGRRVLVIAAPGADDREVSAVSAALTGSGATLSGTLHLLAPYADPGRGSELEALVTRLIPPGVRMPAQRRPSSVAAAVLARALVAPRAQAAGDVAESAVTLLAGLRYGGFVRHDGTPQAGATLAVIVVPAAQATTAGVPAAVADLAVGLRARAPASSW
jgi:hypothetical protein